MEQKPTVPPPAEETAVPPAPASSDSSDEAKPSSLFPLSDSSSLQTTTSVPQWLYNSSFTTDVSLINDAVASQLNREATESPPQNDDVDDEDNRGQEKPFRSSYEILESSESDGDRRGREKKEKKRKKKKRKRDRSGERGGYDGYGSRKSRVRAWADSESNTSKDYYVDSHGDRDNLAFGSMYR